MCFFQAERCTAWFGGCIAPGAALIWAVSATVSGVNIHTIGVILLIVGVVGFATSLFFWSSWGGFSARGRTAAGGTTTTVTRDRVVEQ